MFPPSNKWAIYNVIVYLRMLSIIPLSILAGLVLLGQSPQLYGSLLLGLFVLVMIGDAIDGRLARAANDVTAWGQRMDPLADKLVTSLMLVAMALLNPSVFVVSCITVLLIRDLVVSWRRRRRAMYGQDPLPASQWGKRKTLWQTITITLFLCALITPAGVTGFSIFTLAYHGALIISIVYSLLSARRYIIDDAV